MSSRTILHFKDGSTLTDKEIYPHQVSEEQLEELTSVERVIAGWHLSILKSEMIKGFFIMTEAFQSLMLGKLGKFGPPPKISMRALGCYLKDSDPPVKILLGMDPRTKSIVLESSWVKNFRPDGFALPLNKAKRGTLKRTVTRTMGVGIEWTIVNEPPIRRVYGIPDGLGCVISVNETQRAKMELRIQGMNCHLVIESK